METKSYFLVFIIFHFLLVLDAFEYDPNINATKNANANVESNLKASRPSQYNGKFGILETILKNRTINQGDPNPLEHIREKRNCYKCVWTPEEEKAAIIFLFIVMGFAALYYIVLIIWGNYCGRKIPSETESTSNCNRSCPSSVLPPLPPFPVVKYLPPDNCGSNNNQTQRPQSAPLPGNQDLPPPYSR